MTVLSDTWLGLKTRGAHALTQNYTNTSAQRERKAAGLSVCLSLSNIQFLQTVAKMKQLEGSRHAPDLTPENIPVIMPPNEEPCSSPWSPPCQRRTALAKWLSLRLRSDEAITEMFLC